MQRRSFITLNSEKDWRRGLMIGLSVEDDRLVMSDKASVSRGLFYSASIDSGETDFEWDRLIVQADIPPDTLFRISAFASNDRSFEDEATLDDYLKDPYIPPVVKASRLDGLFTESYSGMRDLLLKCRGRYIWLKFELVATGAKKPSIESVRLQFTGDHMIDYLPAIYRKDGKNSFTRRFLSIFNSLVLDKASCDELGVSFRTVRIAPLPGNPTEADLETFNSNFLNGCRRLVNEGIDAFLLTADMVKSDEVFAEFMRIFDEARIPVFVQSGDWVAKGCLLTVSTYDAKELGLFVTNAIGQILNGAKPEEILQEYVSTPYLILNIDSAKKLGIMPPFEMLISCEKIYTSENSPEGAD